MSFVIFHLSTFKNGFFISDEHIPPVLCHKIVINSTQKLMFSLELSAKITMLNNIYAKESIYEKSKDNHRFLL